MLKLIQLCRITQNDWYLTELDKQSSIPGGQMNYYGLDITTVLRGVIAEFHCFST